MEDTLVADLRAQVKEELNVTADQTVSKETERMVWQKYGLMAPILTEYEQMLLSLLENTSAFSGVGDLA